MKKFKLLLVAAVMSLCTACSINASNDHIILGTQGSFFVGGTVKTAPGTYDTQQPLKSDGQTLHGDHAYVQYQIPVQPKENPLVFLHGAGQSARTWDTTPDGREGCHHLLAAAFCHLSCRSASSRACRAQYRRRDH